MRLEFDYRDLFNILKKYILLFIVIFASTITISFIIGKLSRVEKYASMFSIQISNESELKDGEDKDKEINEILFKIETLVKSDEFMENVVNRLDKNDNIRNKFDVRENISFIYDIDNAVIEVVTTLSDKEKSLVMASVLKSIAEDTLSKKILEVELSYSDITEIVSLELFNSNQYYIELGVFLGIFIDIIVFLGVLLRENKRRNYGKN